MNKIRCKNSIIKKILEFDISFYKVLNILKQFSEHMFSTLLWDKYSIQSTIYYYKINECLKDSLSIEKKPTH